MPDVDTVRINIGTQWPTRTEVWRPVIDDIEADSVATAGRVDRLPRGPALRRSTK